MSLAAEAAPIKMTTTADGIRQVMQAVAPEGPTAASADPAKYFDNGYVERLEREGFYARLGA